MERQGKCTKCKVGLMWDGQPPLHSAYCGTCGAKLQRTSHQLTWPWHKASGQRPVRRGPRVGSITYTGRIQV